MHQDLEKGMKPNPFPFPRQTMGTVMLTKEASGQYLGSLSKHPRQKPVLSEWSPPYSIGVLDE